MITERHPPASIPSAAPPRIRSIGSPHGSRGETSPAARRAKASSAPGSNRKARSAAAIGP